LQGADEMGHRRVTAWRAARARRWQLMDEIGERISRAAESILENESLTADLDDTAAKELVAWAVACSEMIAAGTAGLNAPAAEEAMYPRMRATRRLMRAVNRWLPQRELMDWEGNRRALEEVIELAAVIYGGDSFPPNDARWTEFLCLNLLAPSHQVILDLRRLLEGK
jgi:hypothetical protein